MCVIQFNILNTQQQKKKVDPIIEVMTKMIEIIYEIQLSNQNKISGKINTKAGTKLQKIKKQILQFEDLKNYNMFKVLISTKSNNGLLLLAKEDEGLLQGTIKIVLRQVKQPPSRLSRNNSVLSAKSRKMSEDKDSMFQQTSMLIQDFQEENFIQQQPEIPPTVCGYVTQPNSWFFCFSRRRYLVLNSQQMIFYSRKNDKVPVYRIKLQQVKDLKSYKRKDFYCMRINQYATNQKQTINLRFVNKDVCKQWVGYINQCLKFSHYLRQKKAYSNLESFQKFIETFLNKNMESTNVVTLQDAQDVNIQTVHLDHPSEANQTQQRIYSKIIKLSDFNITHKIDSGSFSMVYFATKNDLKIALKQMPKQKLLFKGQMKYAVTQLNVLIKSKQCPYIIPLYYAFQTHQYIYLGLKYISYGNLGRYIQKKKKLQQKDAILLLAQLIVAIEFLHNKNILYRDLKPQNILLDKDGHIYLTDFGLAKQLQETDEQAHSFLGTPLYLAPQRFLGDGSGIDYRSDIYAVGIIFFQMLHGFHPFQADNFNSVVYNIKNTDVQIDQDLSTLTKKFLTEALEKNPNKRLRKMSEHILFKSMDWKKLLKRQLPGIKLLQQPSKSLVQVQYQIDKDYTQQTYPDKKILGWNYSYEQENSN